MADNSGKIKKDFMVNKDVVDEFDKLVKETTPYNRSTWIELQMREFIKKNKKKSE